MSDSFCTFLSATPNPTHNSHAPPKITTISSVAQPFCFCNHCNHLLTFNHHVAHHDHVAEDGRSNKGCDDVQLQPHHQVSSRWSPTPVQLLVLEELYRKGMKTPSAEQIQQIASQLRQFGKIEGKNVFYWFQNHKARERQKRRRREMEEITATSSTYNQGLKETGCGVKETKKWASTSNCSEHAEESAAALEIAEKGSISSSNVWAQQSQCDQFDEREIQVLRKNIAEIRHAKFQNMEIMPCLFPPFTMPPSSSAEYITNTQLLTPNPNYVLNRETSSYSFINYYEQENNNNNEYPRTLNLFPVKKDGSQDQEEEEDNNNIYVADQKKSMETDDEINSDQFFEFLPLR